MIEGMSEVSRSTDFQISLRGMYGNFKASEETLMKTIA